MSALSVHDARAGPKVNNDAVALKNPVWSSKVDGLRNAAGRPFLRVANLRLIGAGWRLNMIRRRLLASVPRVRNRPSGETKLQGGTSLRISSLRPVSLG